MHTAAVAPLCRSHTGSRIPPVVPSQESTWPCLFPFSLSAQKSLFLSAGDNCLANNSSLGSRESTVSNSHQAGGRSKRDEGLSGTICSSKASLGQQRRLLELSNWE